MIQVKWWACKDDGDDVGDDNDVGTMMMIRVKWWAATAADDDNDDEDDDDDDDNNDNEDDDTEWGPGPVLGHVHPEPSGQPGQVHEAGGGEQRHQWRGAWLNHQAGGCRSVKI